eukprot:COSAG02_NODE_5_length_66751_cov_63.939148_32_plen_47_part_00
MAIVVYRDETWSTFSALIIGSPAKSIVCLFKEHVASAADVMSLPAT